MDTETTEYTATDFAKDLAVETVKGIVVTAAGYVTAFGMLAAAGAIVKKVQDYKAKKTTETTEN